MAGDKVLGGSVGMTEQEQYRKQQEAVGGSMRQGSMSPAFDRHASLPPTVTEQERPHITTCT
jgi:hypothetical protein